MPSSPLAIVTGASSGVGRETALLLAEANYKVQLVGRNRSRLDEAAASANARAADKVTCNAVVADICSAEACRTLIQQTEATFGRIDVLLNVAGYASLTPLEQINEPTWRKVIDTNLSSVVHLTSAVWPVFTRQGSGMIVNVSSLASFNPFPHFSMYASAKAGLNMFTHCTANEGESINVRCVCIAPGAIETTMLRSLFDEETVPTTSTLSPRQVAKFIRDHIVGTRAFKSGETIQLPSP